MELIFQHVADRLSIGYPESMQQSYRSYTKLNAGYNHWYFHNLQSVQKISVPKMESSNPEKQHDCYYPGRLNILFVKTI
jgi:hypothetical protein